MTILTKSVKRTTKSYRHEKSKTRAYILSLEPTAKVGVRLFGTRQTYRLEAAAIYELAVRAHEREIEREASRIAKAEKISIRKARTKARRVCQKLLK